MRNEHDLRTYTNVLRRQGRAQAIIYQRFGGTYYLLLHDLGFRYLALGVHRRLPRNNCWRSRIGQTRCKLCVLLENSVPLQPYFFLYCYSLRLQSHASRSDNSATFSLSQWGLLCNTQAESGIIKSRKCRNCIKMVLVSLYDGFSISRVSRHKN